MKSLALPVSTSSLRVGCIGLKNITSLDLSGHNLVYLKEANWKAFWYGVKAAEIKVLELSNNLLDDFEVGMWTTFWCLARSSHISELTLGKSLNFVFHSIWLEFLEGIKGLEINLNIEDNELSDLQNAQVQAAINDKTQLSNEEKETTDKIKSLLSFFKKDYSNHRELLVHLWLYEKNSAKDFPLEIMPETVPAMLALLQDNKIKKIVRNVIWRQISYLAPYEFKPNNFVCPSNLVDMISWFYHRKLANTQSINFHGHGFRSFKGIILQTLFSA